MLIEEINGMIRLDVIAAQQARFTEARRENSFSVEGYSSASNLTDISTNAFGENVPPEWFAAAKEVLNNTEMVSVTLMVIGHRHFGNPIPQTWYDAATELVLQILEDYQNTVASKPVARVSSNPRG